MGLPLWRWEVGEPGLAALLDALLPIGGFVAAGRAERVALIRAGDLGDPPATWLWGRAFDGQREVCWRREGGRATVVLAGAAPAKPPPGGTAHPDSQRWKRLEEVLAEDGFGEADVDRPSRLLLWSPEDLRLPCRPTLPDLGGEQLAITVEEWFDSAGLAWCRYVDVREAGVG